MESTSIYAALALSLIHIYTLTSLPGGGIIVCAEVRQNLLYRAVTPSGKRFGNLLRCW